MVNFRNDFLKYRYKIFYSIVSLSGTIGRNMISYGMSMANIPEHQRNYQKYYQWVPICLTIQALSLYLPAFLWKCWEKNTLHRLIGDLSKFKDSLSMISPLEYLV